MTKRNTDKPLAFGGRVDDRAQAAQYLGMSVAFLNKDACKNGKHVVPFFKLGGKPMYDFDKLDELRHTMQVQPPPKSKRLERRV